jgi:hypothetical protein
MKFLNKVAIQKYCFGQGMGLESAFLRTRSEERLGGESTQQSDFTPFVVENAGAQEGRLPAYGRHRQSLCKDCRQHMMLLEHTQQPTTASRRSWLVGQQGLQGSFYNNLDSPRVIVRILSFTLKETTPPYCRPICYSCNPAQGARAHFHTHIIHTPPTHLYHSYNHTEH